MKKYKVLKKNQDMSVILVKYGQKGIERIAIP